MSPVRIFLTIITLCFCTYAAANNNGLNTLINRHQTAIKNTTEFLAKINEVEKTLKKESLPGVSLILGDLKEVLSKLNGVHNMAIGSLKKTLCYKDSDLIPFRLEQLSEKLKVLMEAYGKLTQKSRDLEKAAQATSHIESEVHELENSRKSHCGIQ